MLEKIFSSSSSTQNTRWSGLRETAHGISTIISYSYVDGERDYQLQIFPSLILCSGFKFEVSPLKACQKR